MTMLFTMAARIAFILLATLALSGCNNQRAPSTPGTPAPAPAAEASALAESAAPTTAPSTVEAALPTLTAFVVDVGQGDATVVLGPGEGDARKVLLIDGGNRRPDGGMIIADVLAKEGVEHVDYVVLSHFNGDHIGGFVSISGSTSLLWNCGDSEECECAPTGLVPGAGVYDQGEDTNDSKSSNEWRSCVTQISAERGVPYVKVEQGQGLDTVLELGGGFSARLVTGDGYVIDTAEPVDKADSPNERSIAVLVSNGSFDFPVTRDLIGIKTNDTEDAKVEDALGKALEGRGIDIEVLRTGHHGAANVTAPTFIQKIKPEVGIISTGDVQGANYKRPKCQTLSTLANNNVGLILQTETGRPDCANPPGDAVIVDGTIRIDAHGSTYDITSYGATSLATDNPRPQSRIAVRSPMAVPLKGGNAARFVRAESHAGTRVLPQPASAISLRAVPAKPTTP